MSYSFIQDINDIGDFYKSGGQYSKFLDVAKVSFESNVQMVQDIKTRSESFNNILNKTIPIMYCIAWETFHNQLKKSDRTKYDQHFTLYEKNNPGKNKVYYNEQIEEIFLIRNCIVHRNSEVSDELRESRFNTFIVNGNFIEVTEVALETQFQIFKDAYNKIIENN